MSTTTDSPLADELRERQHTVGITDDEADWLEAWETAHEIPSEWRDQQQVGISRDNDLGLAIQGLDAFGIPAHQDHGIGNARIGGGWYLHIDSIHAAKGWLRGWYVDVQGLEAFAEAFGIVAPAWMTEPLGPFYNRTRTAFDKQTAYKALLNRIVSILVFVSAATIDASPDLNDRLVSHGGLRLSDLHSPIEPTAVAAAGYPVTGSPSVEDHVIGDPERPGGWGWSIASFHPFGGDGGYLGSVRGLAAFCTALGAAFPDDADEDIGPIHHERFPETDYAVIFHSVLMRALATLWHASRAALDSYPPAAAVIEEQQKRFDAELERDVARELAKRRMQLRKDRPPAPLVVRATEAARAHGLDPDHPASPLAGENIPW